MNKKAKVFSFDQPEQSLGFLLWKTTNAWQRGIRKALEPFDLTHGQFVLLAGLYWLSQDNNQVTQIILADHTGVDKMMTSSLIRTLEAKALVKRVDDKVDTRAKLLTITNKGVNKLQPAVKAVEQFDKEFFGQLGQKQGSFQKSLQNLG